MTMFRALQGVAGRLLNVDGQQYRYFGGTAYLGLLNNPGYVRLYKEGVDRYGVNNGTSRANNVQLGIYDEAEEYLADRFDFEKSALLSSGYLAGQVAVATLSNRGEVLYAPGAHPALWFGEVAQDDRTFEEWRDDSIRYVNKSSETDFVIVSNTLDNLTPCSFDFLPFMQLCHPDKRLLFILDDSHGLGIWKENKVSVDLAMFNEKANVEVVLIASLAKGIGTDAGIVMGRKGTIEQIKLHPIFRGASPPSPAGIYALLNGESLYRNAFQLMQNNIQHFTELLGGSVSLTSLSEFPVFTSNDPMLYDRLLSKRIVISSFPYPFPYSSLLNRIVITAEHLKEDLNSLVESKLLKRQ